MLKISLGSKQKGGKKRRKKKGSSPLFHLASIKKKNHQKVRERNFIKKKNNHLKADIFKSIYPSEDMD